ncbi:sensor histidine kinase [Ramlibacter albus]|uniref:C4-dicarboxylate transport sensor protein DctB n=1 Tax=Ramlibacter albus TaxID=2079448 RepID=A0A923S486_9BURK|nr:ATP-binding protein [Ramlibacter albus]MBC5767329.1 sensor histidine kinase [Ramlibacter albus]
MAASALTRRALPYLVAAALCLLCGWAAFQAALAAQLNAEKAASARRLEFFTLSLENTLSRHEALPGLMVLERKLGAALDRESGARAAANHYLEAVAQAARLSAAYLMDAEGETLAASNWNQQVNFVGRNYAFRPYVREALAGSFGRFYGIGATTGEAGYFLASKLRSPGGAQGVIAIKVGLQPFEDALRQSGEAVLLVDRAGVVILSSVPEWKYSALQPLDAAARARLADARQYGGQPLPAITPGGIAPAQREARVARGGVDADYAIVRQGVGVLGWQMLVLVDQRAARASAAVAAVAGAALAAIVVGLWFHLRLARAEREKTRRAERELREVSEELDRKSAQLQRTEAILRTANDAAVQAGKLTMLGQMSAGMTHELNQPLAALHTLSDNAVQLIEHGRVAEARENLTLIAQLVARMGRIVTQLKVFARKEPGTMGDVDVLRAVDNALLILEPARREAGASIDTSGVQARLHVRADAVRLEQVIVNLLRNGLDAAGHGGALRVWTRCEGGAVTVFVHDNGPGLAQEALGRLFEPFHTTKPVGQGLGLGLALSLTIVESFGGRLEGRNAADGGAEFSVRLEAA